MTDKINNRETKKTRLRLSERLRLVASFVPEGSRIADIGTDHGYVPIYLAEIGKIKSALAMDGPAAPGNRIFAPCYCLLRKGVSGSGSDPL